MNKSILLLTLILCASCKPDCTQMGGHDSMIINNLSLRTIEVGLVSNYPDTVIPITYNFLADYAPPILPNSSYQTPSGNTKSECYEGIFANGAIYWLYFIDGDSLNTIPWDTIRITGRGVLERRVIDLNYLQTHNFTITYE